MDGEMVTRNQAMGKLENGSTRASDGERQKILAHLRRAHTEGRLTGEHFHARAEAAVNAASQVELAELIRDLPAPARRQRRVIRAADYVAEVHDAHVNIFWAATIFGIVMAATVATAVPLAILGAEDMWNSPWGLIPGVSYILGAIGVIICIVAWACD